MNKNKTSSVTIELLKLIDIFKISGHGHAVERLGFTENECMNNSYISMDELIEKLMKTHQEEMIEKLCLESECWAKANTGSIHNFLNLLQAEKLTQLLELTSQDVKKTSKTYQAIQDKKEAKYASQASENTHIHSSQNHSFSDTVSNGDVVALDEEAINMRHNIKGLNLSNAAITPMPQRPKMSVSTGVNSKIYTANAKSRHLPTTPEAAPKNMLSNFVFSGTTSTISLELEEEEKPKKSK